MKNLHFKLNEQNILIKRMKYIIIALFIGLVFILILPFNKSKNSPNFDKVYFEFHQKKMDSLILEKSREIHKLTIEVQKYEREIEDFDKKIKEQDKIIKDRTIELEKTKKRIKELTPNEQQQYWQDAFN